jgi:hypothetical protein
MIEKSPNNFALLGGNGNMFIELKTTAKYDKKYRSPR